MGVSGERIEEARTTHGHLALGDEDGSVLTADRDSGDATASDGLKGVLWEG